MNKGLQHEYCKWGLNTTVCPWDKFINTHPFILNVFIFLIRLQQSMPWSLSPYSSSSTACPLKHTFYDQEGWSLSDLLMSKDVRRKGNKKYCTASIITNCHKLGLVIQKAIHQACFFASVHAQTFTYQSYWQRRQSSPTCHSWDQQSGAEAQRGFDPAQKNRGYSLWEHKLWWIQKANQAEIIKVK